MISHRILLIEDSLMTAEIIEFLLTRQGHEVRIATDGEQGLLVLNEWSPDIVVLDVLMPKVDGYDVLKAIRSNSSTRELPVLMLTGKANAHDITHAIQMGATDYLVKPFKPLDLLERIKQLSHKISGINNN